MCSVSQAEMSISGFGTNHLRELLRFLRFGLARSCCNTRTCRLSGSRADSTFDFPSYNRNFAQVSNPVSQKTVFPTRSRAAFAFWIVKCISIKPGCKFVSPRFTLRGSIIYLLLLYQLQYLKQYSPSLQRPGHCILLIETSGLLGIGPASWQKSTAPEATKSLRSQSPQILRKHARGYSSHARKT